MENRRTVPLMKHYTYLLHIIILPNGFAQNLKRNTQIKHVKKTSYLNVKLSESTFLTNKLFSNVTNNLSDGNVSYTKLKVLKGKVSNELKNSLITETTFVMDCCNLGMKTGKRNR